VLEVPELYVTALWLVSPSNSDDLFIPMGDGGPRALERRPYEESEFTAVLREVQRSSLDESDFPV
jgi:hypothetical protein